MLETLADIVEAAGFMVDTAPDGRTALARMTENRYDVAAFDIVLPDINGIELIRQTRPEHPETKYVIITAYTNTELVERVQAEPVVEIMYKPVDPERLLAALRQLTAPLV
jgi:DNA-binding NarL/FixJ family response regulator